MRGVEIEVRGEDGEALGIRRFNDEDAAGREARVGEADELGDAGRFEMLDDLRAEDAVEREFGGGGEEFEEVGVRDVEVVAAAVGDELFAVFDAAGGDAVLGEQREEFAAAAAEIDDVLAAVEVRQVELVVLADVLFGAAEFLGELPGVELLGVEAGAARMGQRAQAPGARRAGGPRAARCG